MFRTTSAGEISYPESAAPVHAHIDAVLLKIRQPLLDPVSETDLDHQELSVRQRGIDDLLCPAALRPERHRAATTSPQRRRKATVISDRVDTLVFQSLRVEGCGLCGTNTHRVLLASDDAAH